MRITDKEISECFLQGPELPTIGGLPLGPTAFESVPRDRNSRAHAGSLINLFDNCQLETLNTSKSISLRAEISSHHVPDKRLTTSLGRAIRRLEVGNLRRIRI